MIDSHTTLNNAISYASAGNTKKAVRLVKEILAQDSQNDRAWVLLADLTTDPAVAVNSLEKALKINPKNQQVSKKLAGYVSTSKCQEVLGISNEEFQTYLGVEEVFAPNYAQTGRRTLRKKTPAASLNLPLFMLLILVAGFFYLAKPNIQLAFAGEQPQVASAHGSGKVYQAPAESSARGVVANSNEAVTSTGSGSTSQAPVAPVLHSIPSQPRFVTFTQMLDASGVRLLNIPNR